MTTKRTDLMIDIGRSASKAIEGCVGMLDEAVYLEIRDVFGEEDQRVRMVEEGLRDLTHGLKLVKEGLQDL